MIIYSALPINLLGIACGYGTNTQKYLELVSLLIPDTSLKENLRVLLPYPVVEEKTPIKKFKICNDFLLQSTCTNCTVHCLSKIFLKIVFG